MKEIRVVLDCDDVLYSSTQASLDRLNREFGTGYTLSDVKKWGTIEEVLDKRLAYFNDPDFVRSIPIMPGAKEFVKKLSEIAEIFILTSTAASCAGARVDSIISLFPEIDPSNILIGNRKDLVSADFLLDDGAHNIIGSQIKYPVLMRRPWNYHMTGCLAVTNYAEFIKLIHMTCQRQRQPLTNEIVAFVGPSGSGKKELQRRLCENGSKEYTSVITYTTEYFGTKGRYHRMPRKEFVKQKEAGLFFETAVYMGEFYATKAEDINQILANGKACLSLDINGAIAIKLAYGNRCTLIFTRRDKEQCVYNILHQSRERAKTVKRITSIDDEMNNADLCDYVICYSSIDEGFLKLKEVLR